MQATLLQTLADVAAIAIESRRQSQALKMRDRYLADALEQHAATNKILHVILRSRTDPQLVFDTISVAATRLCGAAATNVIMYDGALLHAAAIGIHDPAGVAEVRSAFPRPADRSSIAGRVVLSRSVVAIHDMLVDTEVLSMPKWGFRSVVGVPMLRDGEPIGVIAVGRYPTGPFPEQQIALLKTFADQAVIAIENARLFREIDAQRRQLETASEHKSDFLANVSHELRTPLNAIIGFTRIVSRHSSGLLEPLQLQNLDKILRSAKDLLSLINSLLDLSKVEAGHIEIETAPVALAPLLEQCLHTVEPLLRRSVELASAVEHALPTLLVDGEKLRQIVLNLLANAAKFTAAGRIELCARSQGASVEIVVTDTGIGIARDKLALVFEPFEQADPSTTREHGGSGLGLAIARRLARLMQGDIVVKSTLEVGSTFTLSLPLHYGNTER